MKKKHREELEYPNLYEMICDLQKQIDELQNQHIILLREILKIKNGLD